MPPEAVQLLNYDCWLEKQTTLNLTLFIRHLRGNCNFEHVVASHQSEVWNHSVCTAACTFLYIFNDKLLLNNIKQQKQHETHGGIFYQFGKNYSNIWAYSSTARESGKLMYIHNREKGTTIIGGIHYLNENTAYL